jgi:antitoxin HicB
MKIKERKRSNWGVKDLNYYMNLEYPLTLEEFEEAGKKRYAFSIPDLPGCGAEGDTLEDAHRRLEEAKEDWISVSLDEKLPIPEPDVSDDFSGKFLLRISPKLHMRLSKNAEKEGKSLNQYIRYLLESNVNINYILQEKMNILLSRYDSVENGIYLLSQRLESLENYLSEYLRPMQTYWGANYAWAGLQLDTFEPGDYLTQETQQVSGGLIVSSPGQQISRGSTFYSSQLKSKRTLETL